MAYKYSSQLEGDTAKAVGVSLPISTKQSVMICNMVRGKNVQTAKNELEQVMQGKKAVPFTRFNRDTGHKVGIAGGRFPQKACQNILDIIKSAEANAQFKGLSSSNLVIAHISAQEGPHIWRFGRHRRRRAKRTHVEVVLKEVKAAEQPKKTVKKAPAQKAEVKTEPKKAAPKAEPKPAPQKEAKAPEKKTEAKK